MLRLVSGSLVVPVMKMRAGLSLMKKLKVNSVLEFNNGFVATTWIKRPLNMLIPTMMVKLMDKKLPQLLNNFSNLTKKLLKHSKQK